MVKVRPTSPFLSVYKPQVGSIFSIFERITGVIMILSLILFLLTDSFRSIGLSFYNIYSLVFDVYKGSFDSILVSSFMLFLLSSFIYHLLFGLRFVFWGQTRGVGEPFSLNLESLYKIANVVLALTALLTVIFWILI